MARGTVLGPLSLCVLLSAFWGPPLATALLNLLPLVGRQRPPVCCGRCHSAVLSRSLPLAPCLIFPTYRRRAAQCLGFHRSSPNGLRGQCKIGPALAIGPGWPWVVEWESGFLCLCSAPGVFAFLRLIPEEEVGSMVPLPCTCRGPSPPASLP